MKLGILISLFTLVFAFSMPISAQPPKGWLEGGIDAINLDQRRIIIAEEEYRIALRVRVTDFAGTKLSLQDLDVSYAIAFNIDKETGDILDIQVIAYP